jgi:hypothetical protein
MLHDDPLRACCVALQRSRHVSAKDSACCGTTRQIPELLKSNETANALYWFRSSTFWAEISLLPDKVAVSGLPRRSFEDHGRRKKSKSMNL